MHIGLFIAGKFLLLAALILFSHDMLNYLEFKTFEPTTPLELWQLFIYGYTRARITTGSSFFDTLLLSPSWLVLGVIGGFLYVLFREQAKKYN